jgi:hypothetical protein
MPDIKLQLVVPSRKWVRLQVEHQVPGEHQSLLPSHSTLINKCLHLLVNLRPWVKPFLGYVGKIFHNMKTDPGESCWYEYERFENERNPVLEKARKEFEAENGSIEKASNRRAWRLKQKEAKGGAGGQKIPGYGPTDMSDEEHKDGRNVRRVVSWLDKKSHGARPFFIACGIQKPHVPFWAPKKYFDMYPREKLFTPPALVGDWEDIPALAMVKRFKAFGFELDKCRRRYCFYLRNDEIGFFVINNLTQRVGIQHIDDMTPMGYLHTRRVGVSIDRDHFNAKTLEFDYHFLT